MLCDDWSALVGIYFILSITYIITMAACSILTRCSAALETPVSAETSHLSDLAELNETSMHAPETSACGDVRHLCPVHVACQRSQLDPSAPHGRLPVCSLPRAFQPGALGAWPAPVEPLACRLQHRA